MSDSEEDFIPGTPPEIREQAIAATLDLLPAKSRKLYEKEYDLFMHWCKQKTVSNISESVLLTYLSEKAKTFKCSSLWSKFSMLKAVLNVKNNVDVSNYQKVKAFLKRQSTGYRAKKSKVFDRAHVERFLLEAPDEKFLMLKVVLIMGLAGACRREELYNMTIDDIVRKDCMLVVKVPDSKTHIERTFTVIGETVNGINPLNIYDKYAAIRPTHVNHKGVFLQYRGEKCTVQRVGINTFSKIPSIIAKYLKLSNPEQYTGHSFRRSSASLLAGSGADILTLKRHGGWKSSTVAEGYIEDSIQNKKEISKKIFSNNTTEMTMSADVVVGENQTNHHININESNIFRTSEPIIPGININNVSNSTIHINFR